MQSIIITPQVFLDLFILCLSWQWNPSDVNKTWTTVDKVSRILYGLGIISKKQYASLYKDRRAQHIFYSAICLLPAYYGMKTSKQQDFTRLNAILEGQKSFPLVLNIDPTRDISRRRLLRDYRLHLTLAGKEYADSITSKYEPFITKEMYLIEVKKQEDNKPKSMNAVMKRYKQKVRDDTEEA